VKAWVFFCGQISKSIAISNHSSTLSKRKNGSGGFILTVSCMVSRFRKEKCYGVRIVGERLNIKGKFELFFYFLIIFNMMWYVIQGYMFH